MLNDAQRLSCTMTTHHILCSRSRITPVIALSVCLITDCHLGTPPACLPELPGSSPAALSSLSIAELNLLCVRELSDATEPDLKQCRATIADWAQHVRTDTQRHRYRYDRNPAEFENSPGFFRMLILAVVLAEDYGVHYDPQRITGPAGSSAADGFFSDPRSVFLHGLLGPERVGTCSSIPVLYVAIGRQLGYPLKLVTTRGHLFVRWEGQGERFNIETTGHGLNRFDDDYYRRWPFQITSAEEQAEGYLKSLTPAEEFDAFFSIRGMCLRESRRYSEAAEAFAAAARLAPNCQSYKTMLASLQQAAAASATNSVTSTPKHHQVNL